jgi:hypothetical protein
MNNGIKCAMYLAVLLVTNKSSNFVLVLRDKDHYGYKNQTPHMCMPERIIALY